MDLPALPLLLLPHPIGSQACFELQEQLEAQRSAVAESNAALAAAQSQIRRLEVRRCCAACARCLFVGAGC